jgi:hypothetical protein
MLLPAKFVNMIHALWEVFGEVLPGSECILQQKKKEKSWKMCNQMWTN